MKVAGERGAPSFAEIRARDCSHSTAVPCEHATHVAERRWGIDSPQPLPPPSFVGQVERSDTCRYLKAEGRMAAIANPQSAIG